MAVALTGTPTKGETNFGADAASLTFAHTVPTGTNVELLVGIMIIHATAIDGGVTYNGVAMDAAAAAVRLNGSWYMRWFKLVIASPDGNAHNVVISTDSTVTPIMGQASSWTGADAPTGQASNSVAAANSVDITISSDTGDAVVSLIGTNTTENPTKDALDTALAAFTPLNTGGAAAYRAGAASVTSTWTSTALAALSVLGINIPAAAVASVVDSRISMERPFNMATIGRM
jgi:hypothetical protein